MEKGKVSGFEALVTSSDITLVFHEKCFRELINKKVTIELSLYQPPR
jgi:hypothetical protein